MTSPRWTGPLAGLILSLGLAGCATGPALSPAPAEPSVAAAATPPAPPAPAPVADRRTGGRTSDCAGAHDARRRAGRPRGGASRAGCRDAGLAPARWPRPRRRQLPHRPVEPRARRLCDARPAGRSGRPVGAALRHATRLRRPHDRARQPLPVPHRRGTRSAPDAAGAGAAALHRERLQSAGGVVGAGRRDVAVHAGHRARLRPDARTCSATSAATCWRRPAPRSTTCRACTRCSATGTWRWPPTTGARAMCSGPSSATAPAAARPTTSACGCRPRPATTCPSCRR